MHGALVLVTHHVLRKFRMIERIHYTNKFARPLTKNWCIIYETLPCALLYLSVFNI